ncbi:MAG: isopeptide-forming domain-containing fimbrial protein [Oscillospiraceae bacterium]|nr:isopeptide-forming domain-containing fimbrial protein [Oscillospiraceae bacterium]
MKKLFAVLLVVAMVLSLGVTAFAVDVGKILIPNTSTDTDHVRSRAYKIFDVTETLNADGTTTLTYSLPAEVTLNGATSSVANPWISILTDATTAPMVEAKSDAKGLEFIPVLQDPNAAYDATSNPVVKYNINRTTEFSAEKFASMLKDAVKANADGYPYVDDSGIVDGNGYLKETVEIPVTEKGYYLIVSSGEDNNAFDTTAASFKEPAALTTVLGTDVKVEPKHDIPVDKTVDNDGDGAYEDEGEGVKLGDTLNFKVESKIPFAGADPVAYIYRIWDTMHEGLTFGNTLTIELGDSADYDPSTGASQTGSKNYIKYVITYLPADPNTVPPRYDESITVMKTAWDDTQTKYVTAASTDFILVKDASADLVGNQVRFGADGKTFELSLDIGSNDASSFKSYHDEKVTVKYSATVNEKAVADVLDNRVVLAYGNDANSLNVKDDSTKNYDSKIQIDKFAEGNNSQKLAGAEFVLFRNNPQETATGTTRDAYGNIVYDREYYALVAKGLTTEGTNAATTGTFKESKYYNATGEYYVIANPTFDDNGNLVVPAKLKDSNGHPYFEGFEVMWVKDLMKHDGTGMVATDDPGVADNITRVSTDIDGFAQFGYLPDSSVANNTWTNDNGTTDTTADDYDCVDTDGKYYLQETKAPVDYTKLLNPIAIVVDGSASTDPAMTKAQQDMILTNIANVPNTPGSTLPSTGGVGATMMTIGGVALILAAGAFLVLRRRKEQE